MTCGGRTVAAVVALALQSSGAVLGASITPTATADDNVATGGAVITPTTTSDDNITNGNCTLREAFLATDTNTPVDACTAGIGTSPDVIVLADGATC